MLSVAGSGPSPLFPLQNGYINFDKRRKVRSGSRMPAIWQPVPERERGQSQGSLDWASCSLWAPS